MNRKEEFDKWAYTKPFPVPMTSLGDARKAWDACWNLWRDFIFEHEGKRMQVVAVPDDGEDHYVPRKG